MNEAPCCWFFEYLIKEKILETKEEVFDNGKKMNNTTMYNIHPKYMMWHDDNSNAMKSGWHCFNFCSNCGHKYSSDEQIKAWDQYWNKKK